MKKIYEKNSFRRATISLRLSVDGAAIRLSECLLTAAQCMVRKVYPGPRQSVWFYIECKVLKSELRKWFRKFRRAEIGTEWQKNRIRYMTGRRRHRSLLKSKKQNYKTEKIKKKIKKIKNKKKTLLAKANDPKELWRGLGLWTGWVVQSF